MWSDFSKVCLECGTITFFLANQKFVGRAGLAIPFRFFGWIFCDYVHKMQRIGTIRCQPSDWLKEIEQTTAFFACSSQNAWLIVFENGDLFVSFHIYSRQDKTSWNTPQSVSERCVCIEQLPFSRSFLLESGTMSKMRDHPVVFHIQSMHYWCFW